MFKENREMVNSIDNLEDSEREILYSAINIHGYPRRDRTPRLYPPLRALA